MWGGAPSSRGRFQVGVASIGWIVARSSCLPARGVWWGALARRPRRRRTARAHLLTAHSLLAGSSPLSVPHASPASSARCSASVCSRLASPSLTFMPSTLSSGLTMRTIETQSGDRWQM